MEPKRALWVSDVTDRVALVRLIRVALIHGVTGVELAEAHLPAGVHTLQVRFRGKPVVVLAAEVAGETATGSYALRLAPLDPSHVPELTNIAERDDESLPPSNGPMSESTNASAIFDSEPPLPADGRESSRATQGRRFAKTLPDPEPEEVDEDELEASVLFDPEAALISRAPPRPDGTRPDDTLTVPLRASMVPPAMAPPTKPISPPRPPSGPHTISHLSIPSTVPMTERLEPAEGSATSATVSTLRQGSGEPEMGVTVDFDGSQTAQTLATQRNAEESWTDGASAADPSTAGSVVFDLDVLAREQRSDAREQPAPSKPPRPPGTIVNEDDDLTLTPTIPMDVPVSREAASSGRGPRTQKRSGSAGIVVAGRVIANRYRIESLVGTGAVGAVYKAAHIDLPRTFAIKVLHPHFRTDAQLMASFRTEARAASLLDHPNVTVVHDFGEEPDGLVYIVMEYLPGVNLQSVLDEERRLAPRRAIEIMLQVCGALMAAHDRGIIHRDVKPDNIMLVPSRDDEGRPREVVKVCDFGIAALETAPDAADPEWTAGTPEYMAPEQAHGRADARTDVYACGIVLYEMITGRAPFVADTPIATLAKHANETARRPSELVPDLAPALEAVIMKAIEKAPEQRFATMRQLRVELKRLVG